MNINNSTQRANTSSQGGRRGFSRNAPVNSLMKTLKTDISMDVNISQKLSNSSINNITTAREQIQLNTIQRQQQEDPLTFFRCVEPEFVTHIQRYKAHPMFDDTNEHPKHLNAIEYIQSQLDQPPTSDISAYRSNNTSQQLDEWKHSASIENTSLTSCLPRIIALNSLFLLGFQSPSKQYVDTCINSLQSRTKDSAYLLSQISKQNLLYSFIYPLQQLYYTAYNSQETQEESEQRKSFGIPPNGGSMNSANTSVFANTLHHTSASNPSMQSPLKMLMTHIQKTNEVKKDDLFSDVAMELTRSYLHKKKQLSVTSEEPEYGGMFLSPPVETDGFDNEDDDNNTLLNTWKDVNILQNSLQHVREVVEPVYANNTLEMQDKLIIHTALENHMYQYNMHSNTRSVPVDTMPTFDLPKTIYKVSISHFLRRLTVSRLCMDGNHNTQSDTLGNNQTLILDSLSKSVFKCVEQENAEDVLEFFQPYIPETYALLDTMNTSTISLPEYVHPHNIFQVPKGSVQILELQKHALNSASVKELVALLQFQMESLHMQGQMLLSTHKVESWKNEMSVDLGDSLVQSCCTLNILQNTSNRRLPYTFYNSDQQTHAARYLGGSKYSSNEANMNENTLPSPSYSFLLALAHAPSWMLPITRIDQSENPLGDAGILLLAEAMPFLPCVTYQNLKGTECTGRSLSTLFSHLQGHPALQFLDISSTSSNPNNIGPNVDAVVALASQLMQTKTLHTLLLQDVGLGLHKGAFSTFCIGLAFNGSLHTLDLSKNYLNARHLSQLAGSLVHQRRAIAQFHVLQSASSTRLFSCIQKHQSKHSYTPPVYEKHSYLQMLLVPSTLQNIKSIPEPLRIEVTQSSLLYTTQRIALCLALRSIYNVSNRLLLQPIEDTPVDNRSIMPAKFTVPIARIQARPLSTLLLSGNLFLSVGVLPLIGLLRSGYPLHHLSVSDCGIGTQALACLLQCTNYNPLLISLDVRKNMGFRYNINMGMEIEGKYGGDSTQYSIYSNLSTKAKKNLLQGSQSGQTLSNSGGNQKAGNTTLHQVLSDTTNDNSLMSLSMNEYINSLHVNNNETNITSAKHWLGMLHSTVHNLNVDKQQIHPSFSSYIYNNTKSAAFYLRNIPDPSILASNMQTQRSVSDFYYNKNKAEQDKLSLQKQQVLLPIRSFPDLTLSPRNADIYSRIPNLPRTSVIQFLLNMSPLPTCNTDAYVVATELLSLRNTQIAVALHYGEEYHHDTLFDLRINVGMLFWSKDFFTKTYLSGGPCGWIGNSDPFGILDRTGNSLTTTYTKQVPNLKKYLPFQNTCPSTRKKHQVQTIDKETYIAERQYLPDFQYIYDVKRLNNEVQHDIYVNPATNQLLVTAGGTLLDLLDVPSIPTSTPSTPSTKELLLLNNTSSNYEYHKSILDFNSTCLSPNNNNTTSMLNNKVYTPILISSIDTSTPGLLNLDHLPNSCIICGYYQYNEEPSHHSPYLQTCQCDRTLLYDFHFIEHSYQKITREHDSLLLPLPLHDTPYYGLIQHPCMKKKETSISNGIPSVNIFEKYYKTKYMNLNNLPQLKKQPMKWNQKYIHEGLKQKNPTGLHVLDLSHTYCSSEVLCMQMTSLTGEIKKNNLFLDTNSTNTINANNNNDVDKNDPRHTNLHKLDANSNMTTNSTTNNSNTSNNNTFLQNITSVQGPKHMPLSHLYLAYNSIDAKCLELISQYIRLSTTLTHIDQSNNTFTQSTSNQSSMNTSTTTMDNKTSQLNASTISSTSKQLNTNASLSNFKIVHDLSGIQLLLIALMSSKSLTHINLNHCNLPDKVGLSLILVLMMNPRLTHVNIEGNIFRPETIEILHTILQKNIDTMKQVNRKRKTWMSKALQLHVDRLKRVHIDMHPTRKSNISCTQFIRPSIFMEEKYPLKITENKLNVASIEKKLTEDFDYIEKQSLDEEIEYLQKQVTYKQLQMQTLFQDIPVLMDSENALLQQLQQVLQTTTDLNKETQEKGELLAQGHLEQDILTEYKRDIAKLEQEIMEAEKVIAKIQESEQKHNDNVVSIVKKDDSYNVVTELDYLNEFPKESDVYQIHSTLYSQYKRVYDLKKKLNIYNEELLRNINELTTKTKQTLEEVPKANALFTSLEVELCKQHMSMEENMNVSGKNMRKCMKTLMNELTERSKNTILSSMTNRRVSPELESLFTCTFTGDKLATDVVLEIPIEEIQEKQAEQAPIKEEVKSKGISAVAKVQQVVQQTDRKKKKKSKALEEEFLPQKLVLDPINIFSSLQRLS